MKLEHIISAAALFLLLAFLGVWLCSLLLGRKTETDLILPPPMSVQLPVSVPSSSESAASNIPQPSESESPESRSAEGELSESAPADLVADIGFELSSTEAYPGEFVVLYAYGIEDAAQIKVTSPFSRAPEFFDCGDHLAALLPVKYTYEPGEYLITAQGGGHSEDFTLHLLSKEWQTQHLTVDESVTSETIDNSAANDEYFAKVQPKKSLSEPAALWQGSFIQPVEGRITTEFGMLRTVNGVPSDRHGGVDIAAERGTPVKAANGGRVLFAQLIALTGNTVCIEHGMGLKTWYYHMDSLAVNEGDVVSKGAQIGTVGSTGFSTGPHLHWAASVFDVYVNPWSLIEKAPAV